MRSKLTKLVKLNDSVSSLKSEVMSDFNDYNVSEYWCIMAHLDDVSDLIRKVFKIENGAEHPAINDWSMMNNDY